MNYNREFITTDAIFLDFIQIYFYLRLPKE